MFLFLSSFLRKRYVVRVPESEEIVNPSSLMDIRFPFRLDSALLAAGSLHVPFSFLSSDLDSCDLPVARFPPICLSLFGLNSCFLTARKNLRLKEMRPSATCRHCTADKQFHRHELVTCRFPNDTELKVCRSLDRRRRRRRIQL